MIQVRRLYIVIAIFILPILYLLQNPHIYEPIHKFSWTMLKPAILVAHSASSVFSTTKNSVINFWNSVLKQHEYEAYIDQLQAKLVRFEEIDQENRRLRELFDFKESVPSETVAVRVIGRDISLSRKTFFLDKGSVQGVEKDFVLLSPQGLVGRVIEVSPVNAKAILLTDPDSRVSVMTGKSRSHGVVAGDGSGRLILQYLELDSGVEVGEHVVSSGMGGIIPKGLAVGKIESLEKEADGLHLKAKVIPFVRFSKLEEVLCFGSSR